MKESEPNYKTPHQNFNSMSDETHGKSELTEHKQSKGYKRNKKRREAKSIRMIHSTFGSQSNTIRYNVRARAITERKFFLSFCLLSLSALGEKKTLSQHTAWI